MKRIPGHSSRGLCVAGLLVLAAGLGAAYLVRHYGNVMYVNERVRIVLLVTVIASGICFIAASARWWMRH